MVHHSCYDCACVIDRGQTGPTSQDLRNTGPVGSAQSTAQQPLVAYAHSEQVQGTAMASSIRCTSSSIQAFMRGRVTWELEVQTNTALPTTYGHGSAYKHTAADVALGVQHVLIRAQLFALLVHDSVRQGPDSLLERWTG